MKYILLIFCSFSLSIAQAQSSKLSIVSLDSTIFQAAVNGVLISDSSSFEAIDSNFVSNTALLIDIVIPSEKDYHLSSEIEVENNRHDIYNLQKLGDKFVLILFLSKDWSSPNSQIPILETPIVIDSLSTDSLLSDSLLHLTYTIPDGCVLQNAYKHELFMNELSRMDFEFQREKKISVLFSDICVTSSQAEEIFASVDFEDKRLEMLLKYQSKIVDSDVLNKLADLFLLKINREKFLEAIE